MTEGLGVEPGERFGELLGARLAVRRLEVLNFGISGFATIHEKELLSSEVFLYGPNIVILQIGSNDLDRNMEPLRPAGTRPVGPSSPPAPGIRTFLQKRSALYLFLAERFGWLHLRLGVRDSVLRGLENLPDRQYEVLATLLKEIKDLCQQNNAQLYIAYFPLQGEVLIRNNAIAFEISNRVSKIGADLGTKVVDVLEPLRSHTECNPFIDDVHLSPCGHSIVAEVLAGTLKGSRAFTR